MFSTPVLAVAFISLQLFVALQILFLTITQVLTNCCITQLAKMADKAASSSSVGGVVGQGKEVVELYKAYKQLWIWPLLPHPLHANPGHLHPVHLHLPHQLVHRQLGQPHPLPCPWILGTHPWPSRQCHRYYFCIIFFSFPSLLSAIAQPLIP